MNALEWFSKITKIPRPSGYEDRVTEFLVDIAKAKQYHWRIDHVGNLCIEVPAKGHGVGKPTIVLQSHMDMVCEKLPEVTHDFMKDALDVYEEDGYLKARGTTLGADNGVGIALSLGALNYTNCPPLELLFTVDEEVSMKGAKSMQSNFFQGKYLINLDSEDDTQFTTGCAGSMVVKFTLPIVRDKDYPTAVKARFTVDKLVGGHSGTDIHKNRAAATKVCTEQLLAFEKANIQFRLVEIEAGRAANAIARFGTMILAFLTQEDFNKARTLLLDVSEDNPAGQPVITFEKVEVDTLPLDPVTHDRLIGLVYELPHGPIVYYDQAAGLVETSCNFSSIASENQNYVITLFYRSFVDKKLVNIGEAISRVASRHSVHIEIEDPDPAWPPRKDNALLDIAINSYKKLFNKAVTAMPIHAGLECGYLEKLSPGLIAISIGPNIFDPHSPTERLEIGSLARIEQLLFNIINEFIEKT